MKKETKYAIWIFGNIFVAFILFAFIIIATIPLLLFNSFITSMDLNQFSIFIQILLMIPLMFSVILTAFIQVVWVGIIFSYLHAKENDQPFTESLKYTKDYWNKFVSKVLNDIMKRKGVFNVN